MFYTQQAIYVIATDVNGPCKIGRSRDPDYRVKQLQTGNPYPLQVWYRFLTAEATRLETLIKDLVQHRQLTGEWFDLTVEEAKEVCISASLGITLTLS